MNIMGRILSLSAGPAFDWIAQNDFARHCRAKCWFHVEQLKLA
jgi:hypothetical protein